MSGRESLLLRWVCDALFESPGYRLCGGVPVCVRHQRSGEGAPDCQLAIGGKHWADAGAESDPSLWRWWRTLAARPRPPDPQVKRRFDRDAFDHFNQYHAELSHIAGK